MLISSSVPSTLLSALPFVFVTPDTHVITPAALQMAANPTPQVTKHFFQQHIRDIKDRLEDVTALGPAAAEEWFKGLGNQRTERFADSSRWERWESTGALRHALFKIRTLTHQDPMIPTRHDTTPTPADPAFSYIEPPNVNAHPNSSTTAHPGPFSAAPPTPTQTCKSNPFFTLLEYFHSSSDACHNVATGPPPRISISPNQNGYPHPPYGGFKQPRVERSIREVTELKAGRKADIERRCQELQSPMGPNILQYMESFQNALQISMPLTDAQWEILRPRLLAQREEAEKKEQERVAQSTRSQAKIEELRRQEATNREAKDLLDKEWDQVQNPIRDRIGRYADEIIKDHWSGGERITKDTSPKFAADVLIYVRRRFYSDLAQDDQKALARGLQVDRDPPTGPPTRRLILENMKWLFDTKIRPLTEQFRKELFLCHGCDNPSKFYGFEGVIQHFAAKHTNALSQGSIVVHWKAEWPEHPPFHPEPIAAKTALYAVPPLGAASAMSAYNHGAHPQGPGHASQMGPLGGHSRFSQFSPVPFGPQQGMFAPPPYQGSPNPYSASLPNYHQGNPNGYQGQASAYQGPAPGFEGYPSPYHAHAHPHGFGSPHPGQAYPAPLQVPPIGQHPAYGPRPHQFNHSAGPPPTFGQPYPPTHPSPHLAKAAGGMYQTQLEEMASIARELWSSTSGIKDLSGSIRTHVIINQTVARFMAKFSNEPGLDMFADGLANHTKMKPLNNFNGLPCKACHNGGPGPGSGYHSHPPRYPAGDRRLFTLPNLLGHFKTVHLERGMPPAGAHMGPYPSRLDWKTDMVELPDRPNIADLVHAIGMDDSKLQLIAQVFPDAFPWPLPVLGPAHNSGPVPFMHAPPDSVQTEATGAEMKPEAEADRDWHDKVPPYSEPVRSHTRHDDSAPGDSASLRDGRAQRRYDDDPRPAHIQIGRRAGRQEDGRTRPSRPGGYERGQYPDERYAEAGDPSSMPMSREHSESQRRPFQGRQRYARGRDYNGDSDKSRRAPYIRQSDQRRTANPPHKPSSPPTLEKQWPGKEVTEEGSEDGEVRGSSVGADGKLDQATPTGEEMSAAERFLNDFRPGEATESYKRKTAEQDRRRDAGSTSTFATEHPGEYSNRRPVDDGHDSRSARREVANIKVEEAEVPESPMRTGTSGARVHGAATPVMGVDPSSSYESRRLDRYARSSPLSGRRAEYTPGVDGRTAISTSIYQPEQPGVEQMRRPRSRYKRYESYRKEERQGRSKSPAVPNGHELEETRFREQSTPQRRTHHYEHVYRARSPIIIRSGPVASDEQRAYGRAPQGRYVAYADDQVDYAGAYEERMEYVPVRRLSARSPPPLGTYVVSPSGPQEVLGGRASYDEEVYQGAYYEDRGRLIRVDRSVYHPDDPRRQSSQPLRY